MTTKKQLKAQMEHLREVLDQREEAYYRACNERDAVKRDLAEAEKLIDQQRYIIKSINASMSCTGCAHLDANGKKRCPQKCQSCRRGAKDRYDKEETL